MPPAVQSPRTCVQLEKSSENCTGSSKLSMMHSSQQHSHPGCQYMIRPPPSGTTSSEPELVDEGLEDVRLLELAVVELLEDVRLLELAEIELDELRMEDSEEEEEDD